MARQSEIRDASAKCGKRPLGHLFFFSEWQMNGLLGQGDWRAKGKLLELLRGRWVLCVHQQEGSGQSKPSHPRDNGLIRPDCVRRQKWQAFKDRSDVPPTIAAGMQGHRRQRTSRRD
jgi:hypothetical protein